MSFEVISGSGFEGEGGGSSRAIKRYWQDARERVVSLHDLQYVSLNLCRC